MKKIPNFGKLILFPALMILWLPYAQTQETEEPRTRGVRRANTELSPVKMGKNYMFVIGIDNYENWLALRNAANDAKGTEEIYAEKFGFVSIVPALYNEQATKDNIEGALDEIRSKLKPEDNLVLFYAGHGETRTDSLAGVAHETGYLIPVDGDKPSNENWASYIEVGSFLTQVALLPAKHIMVILDACHSGIAMGKSISSTRGSSNVPVTSLVTPPSRRVMTSARKNQLASDDGPLPGHGLFTGMMIKGLSTGAADQNGDGRIMTSELGGYVARNVRETSMDRQTPDFGAFMLDERGEMVLELEANTPALVAANANAQLNAGKTRDFLKTVTKLQSLKPVPVSANYLFFRKYLFKNQIDSALHFLNMTLENAENAEKLTASDQLVTRDLGRIKNFFHFWKPYLEVVDSTYRVKVEIIHEGTSVEPLYSRTIYGEYPLPSEAKFKIRLTNESSVPLFPYAIYFDEFARGDSRHLWKDMSIYSQGLQPGESTESYEMTHYGTQGLKEFRLFLSPKQILEFFKPSDVMSQNAKARFEPGFSVYFARLIYDKASRTY